MEKDKPESGAKGGILGKIRMRFGEVARRLGLVSSSDVENALVEQESEKFQRRIGEVLVDDGKMTAGHVGEVLEVQKEWETGAEVLSVKEVKQEPRKAAARKPAKKTVKKKTAKAAARKPAKKSVKKKTAKAAARKPAKAKSTRKRSSRKY